MKRHQYAQIFFWSLGLAILALAAGLPARVAAQAVPGVAQNMERVGDLAAFPGEAVDLAVSGSRVYLACATASYETGNTGFIATIDVSNPASPRLLGTWMPPTNAYRWQMIEAKGSVVYLTGYTADSKSILVSANMSDPNHPQTNSLLISTHGNGIAQKLKIYGERAYLVNNNMLFTLSLTDPAHLSILGTYTLPQMTCEDIDFWQNKAFVAGYRSYGSDGVIIVLNVANASASYEKLITLGPSQARAFLFNLRVNQNMLYCVSGKKNSNTTILGFYDWTQPEGENYWGNYVLPSPYKANSATLSGKLLFAGGPTVNAIDLAHPFTNECLRGSFFTPGEVNAIEAQNGLLYIANGGRGLTILRYTGPGNDILITNLLTSPAWKRGDTRMVRVQTNVRTAGTAIRLELWRQGAKVQDLGMSYDTGGKFILYPKLSTTLTPASDYTVRVISLWDPKIWVESDQFSIE